MKVVVLGAGIEQVAGRLPRRPDVHHRGVDPPAAVHDVRAAGGERAPGGQLARDRGLADDGAQHAARHAVAPVLDHLLPPALAVAVARSRSQPAKRVGMGVEF